MAMTNLVAVTNIVLAAVLGEFSDVAKKLNLPIPTPIREEHVERFSMIGTRTFGAQVRLLSGARFEYSDGHVSGIELPSSFYTLQNVEDIPKFFGTPKLGEAECLALARRCVESLGCGTVLNSMAPTQTDRGYQKQGKTVPRYRFHWIDAEERGLFITATVEIDSERGEMTKLFVLGDAFERTDPPIVRELMPRPRPKGPDDSLPKGAEVLPEAEQRRMLRAVWPQVVEFMVGLGLPKPSGNWAEEIDLKRTQCFRYQGRLCCQLFTVKRQMFRYQRGQVVMYAAPSAYWGDRYAAETSLNPGDFRTNWVYTDKQLVAMTRQVLKERLKLDPERFGLNNRPWPRIETRKIPGRKALRRAVWDWSIPFSEKAFKEEGLSGEFHPFYLKAEADSVTGEITLLALGLDRLPPKPDPDLGGPEPEDAAIKVE